MSHQLFLAAVVLVGAISAFQKDDVAHVTFQGIVTYYPVDQEIIQKKLDKFYETNREYYKSNYQDNSISLFLPNKNVFPGVPKKDKHVMYIDFGELGFRDFKNYAGPCSNLSVLTPVVSLTIPFLCDHPGGPPVYELTTGNIYQPGTKEFANPNLAFDVIPIDELTLTSDMAILRNGSDEMYVSLEAQVDPCKSAKPLVRFEFDELFLGTFHIGAAKPSFDICDRFPDVNSFCSFVKEHREEISSYGTNFCQPPWVSEDTVTCKASVDILNITSGFRDLMWLHDPLGGFLATEYIRGTGTVGLKYPCIE